MESIGEKLRTTREEKGYTIEQVARDTHIAKRFIEGMEAEDFDEFPGEPYLIGFLRTYSEFLELDPQETLTLYKNMKLQETPAPIDELIVRKSPRPWVIASLAVAVVAALGVGAYFLFSSGLFGGAAEETARAGTQSGEETRGADATEAELPEGDEYLLQEVFLEQRFFVGDRVSIPVDDGVQTVTIVNVSDSVTVSTPAGRQAISPGGEEALDLNDDGRGDVRLLARALDPSTNPPSSVLRFDRVLRQPLAGGEGEAAEQAEGFGQETGTPAIGSTSIASREESAMVIRTAETTGPFSVDIDFRGYTYFRAEVDDQPRQEEYFQNGDSFQARAQSEIRLWLSNGGAAQASIGDQSVSLGDAGEVGTYLVTWVPDAENDSFQLELVPLY